MITNSISLLGALDPVAFNLFGWDVHWYGLIIGLGIFLAYFLFANEAKRKGIDSDTSFDLLFWTIIIGFIGARIYYVIFSWEHYMQNPLRIFFIWEGGLAIYGGIIAGIVTLYYLCQRYQIKFIPLLDMAVPPLLLGQAMGRWGNFVNQEAYGSQVSRDFLESLSLPNFIMEGMQINGNYYQPTFLYESTWNLLGLILILVLRRRKRFLLVGDIVALYMLWYGSGRYFIEGLRTDSLYLGNFRVSQIVSILLVIGGIVILARNHYLDREKSNYYSEVIAMERSK